YDQPFTRQVANQRRHDDNQFLEAYTIRRLTFGLYINITHLPYYNQRNMVNMIATSEAAPEPIPNHCCGVIGSLISFCGTKISAPGLIGGSLLKNRNRLVLFTEPFAYNTYALFLNAREDKPPACEIYCLKPFEGAYTAVDGARTSPDILTVCNSLGTRITSPSCKIKSPR